jgi:hypothetical protein
MITVIDPKNTHVADEMYALISRDEDGEGLCGLGQSHPMPLIFVDPTLIPKVIGIAEQMKQYSDKKLFLCKYKRTEIVKEI